MLSMIGVVNFFPDSRILKTKIPAGKILNAPKNIGVVSNIVPFIATIAVPHKKKGATYTMGLKKLGRGFFLCFH